MGVFVTGNTPLPALKTDAFPPTGLSTELDAADVNSLWSAAGDLRAAVLGTPTVINVKDPQWSGGAKGDGVTDDTSAFAAAIASGKEVFVPAGTYIVKNLSIAAAVRLEGAGRSLSVLKLPVLPSLDGSPILNITAGGVAVRHLGFDGQRASQPADGFSDSFNTGTNGTGRAYRALIRAYNAGGEIVGLTVEECLLQNAFGGAVATQNASHVKVRRNIGNNNNFELAILYSTTAVGGGTYYEGHDVSDNEVTNTASGDASVNGNAIILNHAAQFVVANNYVKNTERSCLKCEGCRDGVVEGNVFDTITLGFAAVQLQQDASNIVVVDNKMKNVGLGVNNGFVTGSLGYFNISVNDNLIDTTLSSTTPDGITFTFPTTPLSNNITINDNVMVGIARKGICLSGGAWANAVISGNNIKTTTGGLNSQQGIDIRVDSAGATGLVITDNLVDLNSAVSSGAAISLGQSGGQTIARAVIMNNMVVGQATRTTITDGNVAMVLSGSFGGNTTDGFIRMGSTGLQNVSPNVSGFTAQFQFAGVQMTPVTFANLGTPSNGTVLFCSDATSPSSPATSGGTGALVVRENGAWKAL